MVRKLRNISTSVTPQSVHQNKAHPKPPPNSIWFDCGTWLTVNQGAPSDRLDVILGVKATATIQFFESVTKEGAGCVLGSLWCPWQDERALDKLFHADVLVL